MYISMKVIIYQKCELVIKICKKHCTQGGTTPRKGPSLLNYGTIKFFKQKVLYFYLLEELLQIFYLIPFVNSSINI